MTTINTQPTANYTTSTSYGSGGVQTNADVTDTASVAGSGGESNVERGSLSGPNAANELEYDSAANLVTQILTGTSSTDWGALTDSVASANLSVTITAIMLLLIEIMSEMKQDAREAALEQAQAAHAQGNAAADQMEVAAQETLNAAMVSAITQIVMGAVTVLLAAKQMKDIRDFQVSNTGATSANQLGAPTTRADGGLTRARSDAVTARPALDFSKLQTSLQTQNQLMNGLSGLANSSASLGAAFFTFDASMAEADAQRARTEGDYQQALGQNEQAFMQQLADAIRALLSGWASSESSTHEGYLSAYHA